MFCKWCGGPIRDTEEACPQCGRVTPALSDCGGWYTLKTETERGSTAKLDSEQRALLQQILEAQHRQEKAQRRGKKWATAYFTIVTLLLFVLGSLLWLLLCENREMHKTVEHPSNTTVQVRETTGNEGL